MQSTTDHRYEGPQQLNDTALDAIAGGLNPQPLPPRHGGHAGYKSTLATRPTPRPIIIIGG